MRIPTPSVGPFGFVPRGVRTPAAAIGVLAMLAAAGASDAKAAPTAQLAAAQGEYGGWRAQTAGPRSDAGFRGAKPATRSLRLAAPSRRGMAVVTTNLGSRSTATVTARLNAQRMVLGRGTMRPLLSVRSAAGHGQHAGVVRTRTGVRWAVWRETRRGKRIGVVVSNQRLPVRSWRNASLTTSWSAKRARATLKINGRVVARTRPADLRGVRARTATVGLARATGRNGGATLLLRSAVIRGRTVAPAAPAPAGAGTPTKPGRLPAEQDPYAANFAFNTPIPGDAATDPRSAAIISQFAENTRLAKVILTAGGDVPPVYVAKPSDPMLSVSVGGIRTRFRVPPGAVSGGGSDNPLVILDPAHPDFGRNTELRLWQASIGSGSLSASGAGLFYYNNDGAVLNPDGSHSTSVPFAGAGTGSGLSILAGLIRPGQVADGTIRHAIRFAYSASDFSNRHRAPAIKSDQPKGTSTRNPATAMDMGMRLQLDPAVDCDARTVPGRPANGPETRYLRMVCHALQDYGMIAVDGTGDRGVMLMMENSATANWDAIVGPTVNGSYGYVVRSSSTPADGLSRDATSGIPWERMRVLARSTF